jgi:hypothetical protein
MPFLALEIKKYYNRHLKESLFSKRWITNSNSFGSYPYRKKDLIAEMGIACLNGLMMIAAL